MSVFGQTFDTTVPFRRMAEHQFYQQTGYKGPMGPSRMRRARERAASQGASALRGLVGSYNRAWQEARRANEQRYQQMLDIASQTTSQREADLRADFARQSGELRQGMARRGMAGTSVYETLKTGLSQTEQHMQAALNRLADEMQGTKLGIMERREDPYPDASIITSLAGLLGQGAGPEGAGGILGALGGLRLG